MFYRYEINDDILYLYLTMNYEFSRELGLNSSDKELKRRTKNFIKNNHINFNNGKIYLIVDGIVVKSFEINDEENIETLKENLYYSNDHYLVTIKLDNGAIIEMSLKDYLLGVLATNSVADLDIEVIKSLAVLFRTYAFKEMHENKIINATNNIAIYKPISYYKLSLATNYSKMFSLYEKAIDDTDCIFLTYNDYYILPFVHVANNGITLSDSRYPYLSSVNSLWDFSSPYFVETTKFSYEYLSKLFKFDIKKDTPIEILEVSPYGKLLKIKIGNNTFDGKRFINMLNLKSQYINIIVNTNDIAFITRGFGNFLGISLYGANCLASNGCDYLNILHYYFPKTKFKKYIKELSD
ncbi:MAG: SpoIID/LytB domain-containing protein [Firmicutes bacterium]|nr:SpoIID/LytB domain-containing protein [Bacillota bacterium]